MLESRPVELVKAAGRRLKAARLVLDLTQRQVAEAIEVDAARLSQWETGKHLIDVVAAARFAERYNVSLDFLYRGKIDSLPHRLVVLLDELSSEPEPDPAIARRRRARRKRQLTAA